MSLINRDELRSTTAAEPVPAPDPGATTDVGADPGWRDLLVELHVLSEHGDREAAAAAAEWMATDTAAHDAWHRVEATCRHLRPGRPLDPAGSVTAP